MTPTSLNLQNLLIPASQAEALRLFQQKNVKTEPSSPRKRTISGDSDEDKEEGEPSEKKSRATTERWWGLDFNFCKFVNKYCL